MESQIFKLTTYLVELVTKCLCGVQWTASPKSLSIQQQIRRCKLAFENVLASAGYSAFRASNDVPDSGAAVEWSDAISRGQSVAAEGRRVNS